MLSFGLVSSLPIETLRSHDGRCKLGLLFQIVDDILDGSQEGEPSYVAAVGMPRARELAAGSRGQALELLAEAPGDTRELAELTELIADRTT